MKSIQIAGRLPVALRLPQAGPAADYSAEAQFLSELFARALIVVLFSAMAMRLAGDFLDTGRITGLFLLVSEAIVVVLTLLRRAAATVDRSIRARLLTAGSTMGPLLVAPSAIAALAPEPVTVGIACVGLGVVIAGKITLGRSFALLPANRGIVSTGVYGIVRHPIYMGYLVSHVAFLLASPTLWNATLLVLADAVLLVRAVCEEKTLALDPAYREYQTRVRWRVAPGLF